MRRSVFSRRRSASSAHASARRRKARLNAVERLEPRAMLATIAFGLFSDRSSYNESVSGAVIRTEDWGSGNTVKYWTQQYSYSSASITYTFSFAAPVVSASLVAPVDTPFPGSTGNGYLDVSTGGKWTTIDSCLSQYNGKTNAGYEPIDISPYVNGSTLISVRARLTNSGPVGGQFLRSASWDTTPALRLTVTEQNVTPTDVTLSGASIAENSGIDASVGTLSTTDGNTGDSFTYTLVSGTGSADNSYFNILGNELRANASFDFETKSSYSVRVRSTDQGGLSTEKSFAIYVANVDETPTSLALSAISIAENGGVNVVVGTLSTTDPDAGNAFTYSLVSGTGDIDNAAFNISGDQLRADASLDFETKSSYSIRIRSTDQGGLFTEKAFTIAVSNVNETPTAVALSAASIAENAGADAVVGSLSTTDPDAGDTFTYTLVTGTGSTDNAAFNISGNRLRAISSLDFETKKFHSVRIRSTDQGGLHTERAFTITVTDVVEDWSVVIPDGMESVDGLVRSGSSRLVKSGTGTLVLDHANSHTGGMVVNAGQVIVRNAQALGTGNLWIKPGATVILDVGFGIVPASALIMETGGSIDFGYSKLSVDPLGYVLADVQAWLRAGYKAGFSSDTAGIQSRFASQSRTIGYQVGWDGRITVGYAAMGDTDLSGEVDILDMVSIVSGGKFDSTEAASWADGDFNHDGRVDLLDIVHFVSADLFNRGSYRTATSGMLASSAESTTTSDSNLKSIDKAFAALAIEASTDSASRKKSRGVAV